MEKKEKVYFFNFFLGGGGEGVLYSVYMSQQVMFKL